MHASIPVLVGASLLVGSCRAQVPKTEQDQAQLSESEQKTFIKGLHDRLPLADSVNRVSDGEIPMRTMRAISAILRNTREVEIHRMRGATENETYVSTNGSDEAVYDAEGKLVEDGINDGSYNYFHPQQDSLRHFTFDIVPWLLLGHSSKDPTSRRERVHAYAADVFSGVARARQQKPTAANSDAIDLSQPGAAEAIAVFVTAIERGNAQQMVEVIDSNDGLSDQQLMEIVKRFEHGLLAVTSPEKDQPE